MRERGAILTALAAGLLFIGLLTASSLAGRKAPSFPSESRFGPRRVVSLAPSITETLFALGLDDEIVGVTSFCDYPPEARLKPKVGGFKGKSLEAIMALSPDLVIGTRDGNEEPLLLSLQRLGVRTLTVEPATLTGVIESVRVIGRAVDRTLEAEALARRLEDKLFEVHARVKEARPVKVLFVYGREPLVLAGPGTFADDMIRWAGGVNIAGDSPVPYPRFSLETILARAPEAIVEGAMGDEAEGEKAALAFWSRWSSLPAVQSGKVIVLPQDLLARPGPRIFEGLELLAKRLHPEAFSRARAVKPERGGSRP